MSGQACLGYLWMKGVDGDATRDLPTWSCNLCLLRGGKIIHFDIDPKTQPKGKIPLTDAQAEVSSGAVPGALYSAEDCFKCVTKSRTFHIFAENHENRNKWVNLLSDHIQKLTEDSDAFGKADKNNFELKRQIATSERVEFLTKSGGIKNLSWKKRLFVLNGAFLVYYELPQGLRARGNYSCFNRKQPSASLAADLPPELSSERLIHVDTDSGSLLLGAADAEDLNKWMDALGRPTDSRPDGPSPAPATGAEDYATSMTRLQQGNEEMARKIEELTAMNTRSERSIHALQSDNEKLQQTVAELEGRLGERDREIQHLSSTMERMRIEVMEAQDARLSK